MMQNWLTETVPKHYLTGTCRTRLPEETLQWIAPYLGAMGITRIANVTGLDRLDVPVVMVCRPNSRSVSVSQGKGLTLPAARASGVMEAIELHHAENIMLPLRFGTSAEMSKSVEVVDLARLARVRDRRPHRHLQLLWIEGYELIQRKPIWVPYEVVSVNASVPTTPGGECFSTTSNGLSSGNHMLEALIHGICEVIERDATTLWYLSDRESQARCSIDLSTVDDPECCQVLSKFGAAEIETLVWDITSDIEMPTFLCLITDRTSDPSQTQYTSTGYGCHPYRNVALMRALTEAAQSRLTLIAGSRDDVFREEYEPVSFADVDSFRSLARERNSARRFSDVVSYQSTSFNEDLQTAITLLKGAGLDQLIMVDLTDPLIGIPVVRVIIPGLEGPIPGLEGPRAGAGYTPGSRAQTLLRRRQ